MEKIKLDYSWTHHKIFLDFLNIIDKHGLNEEVIISGSWAVYFLTENIDTLNKDMDLDIFVTKNFLDNLENLKKDFEELGYLKKYTFHDLSWIMKENPDYGFQFMLEKKEHLPKNNINLRPGHLKEFYSIFNKDKIKSKINIFGKEISFYHSGLSSTLITRLLYQESCLNPKVERIENHLSHYERQTKLVKLLVLKYGSEKIMKILEESDYSHLRKILINNLKKPIIFKTKYNGIFFDLVLPNKFFNKRKLVVLLDGFPSMPQCKNVMKRFSQEGYHVILPRYDGCFESDNIFLGRDPSQGISDLIKYIIERGVFNEFYSNKEILLNFPEEDIIFIGSSFGSFVGIKMLQKFPKTKGVLISPIISFKNFYPKFEENMNLLNFIKKGFEKIIRVDEEGFNYLINDKFLDFKKYDNPFLVIYGSEDTNCFKQITEIVKLGENFSVERVEGGHLSLSSLEDEGTLKKVFNWIN